MDIYGTTSEISSKVCTKFGELKPMGEFYANSARKDGYDARCKKCDAERGAAYRATHREEDRARDAAYRANNQDKRRAYNDAHREELSAYFSRYNAEHRDKRCAYDLMRHYGLSSDDYDALFSSQQGKCAICNGDNGGRRLHTDHDHETGKVRGLLCSNCNTAIGLLGDDIELLNKAVLYLKGSAEKVDHGRR
jgi:hypothetical protein